MLASASEARRSLLRLLVPGAEFRAADIDESLLPGEDPAAACERLAGLKALEVARALGDAGRAALVLGADTLAHLDGEAFGKPTSAEDAERILGRLAGTEHEITTGMAICRAGPQGGPQPLASARETTWVRFAPLTPGQVCAYVATGEPMGRSGAYSLQGAGGGLVEEIRGSPSNVVGLPLERLRRLLAQVGAPTRLD